MLPRCIQTCLTLTAILCGASVFAQAPPPPEQAFTDSDCRATAPSPIDPMPYYELTDSARADLFRRVLAHQYLVQDYRHLISEDSRDVLLRAKVSEITISGGSLCADLKTVVAAPLDLLAQRVRVGGIGYSSTRYGSRASNGAQARALRENRLEPIQEMFEGILESFVAVANGSDNMIEHLKREAEDAGHNLGSTERSMLDLPAQGRWLVDRVQRLTDEVMLGFQLMIVAVIGSLASLGFNIVLILMVFAVFWAGYQLVFKGGDIDQFIRSFAQLFIVSGFVLLLLNPVESTLFTGDQPEAHPTMAQDSSGRANASNIQIEVPMMFELATTLQVNLEQQLREDLCGLSADEHGNSRMPTVVVGDRAQSEIRSESAAQWLANNPCSVEAQTRSDLPMANPGVVFAYGVSQAMGLIDLVNDPDLNAGPLSGNLGAYLIVGALVIFSAIIVVIMYFLLAMLFLMVWLEGFAVVGIGVFVLGLGVHEWSRDRAINYMWYSIGWAVRVAMIMFAYFLFHAAFSAAVGSVGLDTIMNERGEIQLLTAFAYCIFKMFEPFMLATLAFTVNNKIGEFFGSSSQAGQQMLGMMNRVASQSMTMAAGFVATRGGDALRSAGKASGIRPHVPPAPPTKTPKIGSAIPSPDISPVSKEGWREPL